MAEIWSKWTLFLSRRSNFMIGVLQGFKTAPLMVAAFFTGAIRGGLEGAWNEWEFAKIQYDTAIACKRYRESGGGE